MKAISLCNKIFKQVSILFVCFFCEENMEIDSFLFFRPVFNIADAAITCGVVSVILFYRHMFQHEEQSQPEELIPAPSSIDDSPTMMGS